MSLKLIKGLGKRKRPTTPAEYAKLITKKGTPENWAKGCIKVVKMLLQTVKGRTKNPNDINEVCRAIHSIHLEYAEIMQLVNKSPKAKKYGVLKPSGFWEYLRRNLPTTYNYYNEWHRRQTGRKMTLTEFKEKYKTGPAPTIKMIKDDPGRLFDAWTKSGMMEKKPEFLDDLLDVCNEGDKVHLEEFKKRFKPA